jgi:hypothetical protein
MTNTLNMAQTMFTFLFGIYFATSITLAGKFQPFDTPSILLNPRKNWRAAVRLLFSFVWLNMLPVLYYIVILNCLSRVIGSPFEFCSVLALLMFSLAGFGFYRMYFGFMLCKHGKNFFFYGKELPPNFGEEWKLRPSSHENWKAQFFAGLIWVLCTTGWGYVWVLLYKP